MAEPTNEPTKDTTPPDDGALDQSMIDSMMNGDAGEGANAAQDSSSSETDPTASDAGEMGQAEIDAMMAGSPGTDPPPGVANSGSPGVQEISQADIDALMGTSSSEDSGSGDDASASEAKPDERLDSLGRPFDAAAAEMQAAMDAEKAEAAAAAPPPAPAPAAVPPPSAPVGTPLLLEELQIPDGLDIDPKRVSMLGDVNLPVNIELGRTEMLVEDVLQLGEGSVVELDKLAGDPVDVYINSRLVARGEVLVLNDNFCVRIGEVISNDPHRVTV